MNVLINKQYRKYFYGITFAGMVLVLWFGLDASATVRAQAVATPTPDSFYPVNLVTLSDGTLLQELVINGPPAPPLGYELERQAVLLPGINFAAGVNVLTVPGFNWIFGCSAVSGAMIAGYYDRNGFPNMYTGPANGGVMPLNNSTWGTWSDGYYPYSYGLNPLVASKLGVDGRTAKGSIDDYWDRYYTYGVVPDPYIAGSWEQHTWGDAIGDYMKTSQSAYGHADAITSFYEYPSGEPFTCEAMKTLHLDDGTLGRKLFYEARGYTVTDCYNQKTDFNSSGYTPGGFSFAQYRAEIDAGRPVMLNLTGHTMVGVGYDTSSNSVYIHDTWDYSTHVMFWGGSYSGMALEAVSIVNLRPPLTLIQPAGTISDLRPSYIWNSSSDASSYRLEVYSQASAGYIIQTDVSPSYCTGSTCTYTPDTALAAGMYRFKVLARYATGDSPFSAWMDFTVSPPAAPVLVSPGGAITDVQPTYIWNASIGASSYQFYVFSNDTTSYVIQKTVATSFCTGDICSYDPAIVLPVGGYRFKVQAMNAIGPGPFSPWTWFTVSLPPGPTNVQATDGTYTDKVQVTWTASSGATSYKVYRATTSTGTQLYRGVSTGTYYDDRTASPGVTYYYWVEAYRSTIYIGITTYNTGWRKLLQPTELQATDATYSNKVRVTWIKSTGATSYKVYRATSATGTQLYLGDSTGSYFDDRTASPGITYYYWVVSCRGTSFSGYDTYDTGWRNLLPPTGVQASDGTHTDKVQVTWNASTGATSYKVYRATSATGTQLYRGVSTGTSYDDTTASPGVTYYYWVVAYRSTRYSATSNYNTGWRNILPPVNMQATDGTYTNKVRVTWTASSGATTYKVYRADTETGEKVYLGASTGTYYDDRTATPGVTYYYWVVACNGTKHNGYSTSDTGWRQ